ncbi:hypothetical protein COCMIDRAFT_111508, partial [Bipolaris oryzae ATCC 44560]
NISLINLLLLRGTLVNITNINNITLLYYYVKYSYKSIIELLLKNSLSINISVY